jgi:PAS domain-containing protein
MEPDISILRKTGHFYFALTTVLGYSPEELEGSSSLEQIHPGDCERVKRTAEESRATGVGQTLEYRIRHELRSNRRKKRCAWRMRISGL